MTHAIILTAIVVAFTLLFVTLFVVWVLCNLPERPAAWARPVPARRPEPARRFVGIRQP